MPTKVPVLPKPTLHVDIPNKSSEIAAAKTVCPFINVDIPVLAAAPSSLILRPSPWLGEYVNLSPVFNP